MNDRYKKIMPYITEYKELIDENKFDKIYRKLLHNSHAKSEDFGLLTEVLYAAGLNPLLYMNNIPSFFMCENQISKFDIPSNIESIRAFAFMNSAIIEISIPSTIKEIKVNAFQRCLNLKSVIFQESSELHRIPSGCFSKCKNLKQVTLPTSIKEIAENAFIGCENLRNIIYNGPYEKFKQIEDYFKSLPDSSLIHVKCTDKEFNLDE